MFAAVSRLPNIYISRYLDIYDAVSGCEAGDLLRVTCCSADPDQAHQAAMTHVPWPATAFLRQEAGSLDIGDCRNSRTIPFCVNIWLIITS